MEGASRPVRTEQLLAHREWVRRVARALVRDENEADDLEQDAWVEALERPPGSPRSLRGWFSTALRHNLIDRRRAENRRKARQEAMARHEAVPSAEELVARAEAHKRVVVAVMDLPEPYRSTVLYRYLEGLKPAEIAVRTGVPAETVRTRTRRALAMLRVRLAAGPGGGRRGLLSGLAPLLEARAADPAIPASGAGAPSVLAAAVLGGMLMSKKVAAGAVAVLLILGLLAVLRPGQGGGVTGGYRGRGGEPPLPSGSAGAGDPAKPTVPGSSSPGPEEAAVPEVPTRWLPVEIRDEAGAVVPGVGVRCLFGPDKDLFPDEVVGDAAGSLSIRVPAESPCVLLARAEGFADTRSNVRPEHERILMFLRGTRFLSGEVVDGATGEPVAGAKVRIFAGSDWDPSRHVWETTTAGDGSFRREGLPPGNFVLGAGQRAWSGDWDYDETRVGPIPADTEDLRIELAAGPVLAGVVLDDTGMPFRGPFNVRARTIVAGRTDVNYLMQYGPSDGSEAGKFRLRHVEPGSYDLTVYPVPVDGVPQPFASAVLRWVAHGSENLEVRLVRGFPIEGQAIDGDGKPVDGAWIFRVFGPDGDVPPAWSREDSRDGRFTTGPLDPRFEYDVLLCTPFTDGRRQRWALPRRVRPGTRDLKVVMKSPAAIDGVLLTSSGESAGSGVPVTAQCLEYRFWRIGMTVTGYTGADGSFSIPVMGPPGDLRFRLCAGGGKSGLQPVVVEGPFQGGQKGIEIRLPPTGETIEGTVRLPKGVPGERLRVRFTAVPSGNGEMGLPWYVESTADEVGRFRVDGLPSGMGALWVRVEDREYFCGEFEAPSTGIDVLVPLK